MTGHWLVGGMGYWEMGTEGEDTAHRVLCFGDDGLSVAQASDLCLSKNKAVGNYAFALLHFRRFCLQLALQRSLE